MVVASDVKALLEDAIKPGGNPPPGDADRGSGKGLSFGTTVTRQFRAGALTGQQQRLFQQCFDTCTANGSPVEFCIPIGGYKKWRLAAFPEVDWAELFHLSLMRSLGFKIASRYRPGVTFTYLWDDLMMLDINANGFPPGSDRDYCRSFQMLLDYLNFLCSGLHVTFSLKKMTDCYQKDSYMETFRQFLGRAEEFWCNPDNSDTVRALEDRSRTHYYCDNGTADQSQVREAAQQIWAHSQVFVDPAVFVDPRSQIPVLLRSGPPRYLCLRPYYSSMVQFWVGEGVVAREGARLYPTIASSAGPPHYRLEGTVPTGEYSFLGRNFRQINVVTKVVDEK